MSVAEEEFEEVDDDIVDEDLNEKESEEGKIKFCYCCSTYTGVSIKAGYQRSTTTCTTSYCRLFGFH